MTRRRRDVTEAELHLLKLLWSHAEQAESATGLTVREIAGVLYPPGSATESATVQTLLTRLERKGFVTRDRTTSPVRYRAAVAREELIDRRLRETADALCEGSLAPLLTRLVESAGLPDTERDRLLDLIDALDDPAGGAS